MFEWIFAPNQPVLPLETSFRTQNQIDFCAR